MPSDRQLNANRRNAARGGPKTKAGRAAVRLNALQHGLTASTPVLPGESPDALKQLRAALFQDYQPANQTEHLLVEEFVQCSWRLLRLRRVDTHTWSVYIRTLRTDAGKGEPTTQDESDRALAGVLHQTPPQNLANLFRYERSITRNFYRVLEELQTIERERRRSRPLAARESAAAADPQLPRVAAAAAAASASSPQDGSNGGPEPARELSAFGIGTVSSPAPLTDPPPAETTQKDTARPAAPAQIGVPPASAQRRQTAVEHGSDPHEPDAEPRVQPWAVSEKKGTFPLPDPLRSYDA